MGKDNECKRKKTKWILNSLLLENEVPEEGMSPGGQFSLMCLGAGTG